MARNVVSKQATPRFRRFSPHARFTNKKKKKKKKTEEYNADEYL